MAEIADKSLVLGIDVGGQSSKLGIVDARGEILVQGVISSLQTELESYITDLTDAINDLVSQVGGTSKVRGIGIGAPNGNWYKGTIEYAPNLKWCYDDNGKPMVIHFAKMISDRVGVPVTVTNDANAAGIGEMTYGIAKGMKNFIMITLGTGVGSGIVIDGKMVYGHDGFAGELGHTIAVPGGRQCACGLKGCLETYCSATGVSRTVKEVLENSDKPSILRDLDQSKPISSYEVFKAAEKGDELAKEIFKYTGEVMGRAFADFVKFSAPEAIVLFGGLAKAGKYLDEHILRTMNENQLPIWRNKIKLLHSTLKDSDAAILGASALAWEL